MPARDIIIIAHNLRSIHNVGSILRTADGHGAEKVYLTGYSPYPRTTNDSRLPHIANKLTKQLHKTALGAEMADNIVYQEDIMTVVARLKTQGYQIVAVEQTDQSLMLPDYTPLAHIALIVGREVEGVEQSVLDQCDVAVEIPMSGRKESFNVSIAAAIALYHCRFAP